MGKILLVVGIICVGLYLHQLPTTDGFEINFPGLGKLVLEDAEDDNIVLLAADEQIEADEAATTPSDDTANESTDEDLDDFDDSELWGDLEVPPEEYGAEWDLQPQQLNGSSCLQLSDVGLIYNLPLELLQGMFYKPQSSESQEHGDKKNVFQTVLSGLQSILDPKRIFQQLDSIPGLVQSMLSSFRLKKAEAIQSVREKMDALSVGLESKIREKFTGENGCVEKLKKCSNAAQRAIQPYQKALHQKVESCIGRIARLVNGHDNEIMNMLQKSNDFLSEFNECKQRPDAFSISFLVEFGKCTAKMFKDRTERALKPLLERFGNLGEQLKSRITTNNGCFDRVLQSKALETLQQQLSATNVKCLL